MNAPLCRFVLAGLLCCPGVSCTTAYDAYGYPRQVVDPAAAVVGAAAVGLLAYGLANSNDHQGHYRPYRSYRRENYYRRGGYQYSSYSYRRPYYGRYGSACDY